MIATAQPPKPAACRSAKRNGTSHAAPRSTPGVIEPTSLYSADEARARLRAGEWAWRRMRRDGLRVLRVGGRAYVLGRDVIAFIEAHGEPTEAEEARS